MLHLFRLYCLAALTTLATLALCASAKRIKVRVADDGAPTKYGQPSGGGGATWEGVKDALKWEEEKKALVVDLLSSGDSAELAERLLAASRTMSSHVGFVGEPAATGQVSASGRVAVARKRQGKRRVAVIGAGLSGLTTAKRLLEEGVHVLLVDKNVSFAVHSALAFPGTLSHAVTAAAPLSALSPPPLRSTLEETLPRLRLASTGAPRRSRTTSAFAIPQTSSSTTR